MLLRLAIATLFCVAALGLPRSSPAQIPGRAGIGVKSGVSVSSFLPKGVEEEITRNTLSYGTSYLFGLYGQIPVTEIFTVQPEALFVRRRSGAGGSRFKLDYLQFPLLVKASFPTGSQIRIHLHAGPYFGIAVQREIAETRVYYESAADDFEPSEFGFSIGLGVEAILQNHVVTLSGRYDIGLTSASKENFFFVSGESVDTRSSVFTVTLGVTI